MIFVVNARDLDVEERIAQTVVKYDKHVHAKSSNIIWRRSNLLR